MNATMEKTSLSSALQNAIKDCQSRPFLMQVSKSIFDYLCKYQVIELGNGLDGYEGVWFFERDIAVEPVPSFKENEISLKLKLKL